MKLFSHLALASIAAAGKAHNPLGSSEKCSEVVLVKELIAQLDYRILVRRTSNNAEINCRINYKKQKKAEEKKSKAARSEAGLGARNGGASKNPKKALKKSKKKAEKNDKKAGKKVKKAQKKQNKHGKHPVTTRVPVKDFEFSDLDGNVVSIEGETPTENPLKGMPLYLECDGVPYFPDKENKNEAYYWRPSRDSPVKEVALFNC
ncbi:Oidioi.mRNA.OKI2018_I69.chr2.g5365.t1.cds [Oikopleura dioica]|uniref:Oidioi.mRNA.OKI2018_I69.chr2.g5365.t1.cds n=1 Tax=Oikopleura dioica TaxID=34765 RepID=A0ABN7T6R1_OIKDI|nr:Oidioi.mRNA.OKI2018_I69.chr2.g5365.t1.cds [Oikopleura dioica]